MLTSLEDEGKQSSTVQYRPYGGQRINKYYTANYAYTNHNFVIQNLLKYSIKSNSEKSKYIPAIYILKNLLQRGTPTLTSKYLQTKIGKIHENENFTLGKALINNDDLHWKRIFRGSPDKQYNPAEQFYNEIIPEYFGDYSFIKNLLMPEVKIYEITKQYDPDLYGQQVDFYLPQAALIIEIDGWQHFENHEYDQKRDAHTSKYGITTVRIEAQDISARNDALLDKIAQIISIIADKVHESVTRKDANKSVISLYDYKEAYKNQISLDAPELIATSIIRTQMLILELLESGQLDFEDQIWNFEVKSHDINNFVEYAIQDLILYFQHIFNMQNIEFEQPRYQIKYLPQNLHFSNNNAIHIDFSLFKRFTDEFQDHTSIIYVRNHYLDEYQYYSDSNATDITNRQFMPYDFFELSTTEPIHYNLDVNDQSIKDSLLYFLDNVFLQDVEDLDFRDGQLPIIVNALSRNDTIGILPTGSGKSVCYQLAAILQPAYSFVVCPIKSLMYDQKADLDNVFFTRTNYITSDLTASEKHHVQNEFAHGKYYFIFISPERFQSKKFRQEFTNIHSVKNIAYAVIDEVHCLSEWGHDFRTSYLNLANTINKLAPDSTYIGLTATASVNVLRDIQTEFDVDDIDIKAPQQFTRKELLFSVIDASRDRYQTLINCLNTLNEDWGIYNQVNNSKCGIIFTHTVNGPKGCYELSNSISSSIQSKVMYYSGSKPKMLQITSEEYDKYKSEIQNDFKNNGFSFLVATKAFGMGINKGNIYFTVHYGMPSSMEALYQEGGRAGRDKKLFKKDPARCLVLFTSEPKESYLEKLWDPKLAVQEFKEEVKSLTKNGDLSTNFFFLASNIATINEEYKLIKKVLTTYYDADCLIQTIHSSKLFSGKQTVEKALYRLCQLGIVEDWTIEDFFSGIFEVQFNLFTENSLYDALNKTILKYEQEFSLDSLKYGDSDKYKHVLDMNIPNSDKYILILLIWSYEHFVGNRKQSMKNVYENCQAYCDNKIDSKQLKETLENYFRINETTHTFQDIADNPMKFQQWFSVFYVSRSGRITNKLIKTNKAIQLKDQLSRFLESYINNTGLNFISGILRLFLDEFKDADGRPRLKASFQVIKERFGAGETNDIIEQTIRITKNLDKKNIGELIELIFEVFNNIEMMDKIYEQTQDETALSILLENNVKRLKNINSSLREIQWEIN